MVNIDLEYIQKRGFWLDIKIIVQNNQSYFRSKFCILVVEGEIMNYVSVIVTFNRKKLLKQAIGKSINQTLLPQKVIIV